MLYDRGRVVVVMQDFLPLEILRRLSESNGVILQSLPSNQQDVPIRIFDTMLQFMFDVALHARNNLLGSREVAAKVFTLVWLYIENCYFKYHWIILDARSRAQTFRV